MTATQPTSAVPAWRVAVIGIVGVLAIGIGIAVGTFLLQARGSAVGSGANYVPAGAPFYVEMRLEPSAAQDASLRELLGRFPEIEGIDLERPLYDQLGELVDRIQSDADAVSWARDVDPWFDGHVGMALLDVPTEAFGVIDPMAPPPIPSMIGLFGVSDRAAAESAIERLRSDAGEGITFTEQTHAGVAIQVAEPGGFAYALADDQLIVAPTADDIVAALDAHASSDTTLSEAGSITQLTDALPADWLAFALFDFTDLMAAAFEHPGAASPGTDALRELMEHQSLRGAMAVTVAGDRLAVETVSDPPTGPLAVENADRGLADEVPSDALYYAEGGNLGEGLAAVIGPLKESFGAMPGAEDQVEMIESALGGDLEELVAWMGDGATVAGWDGEQPYGGILIVPTDADEARRRLDQIAILAGLAALDPASGITVETIEAAGEEITSVRWMDPNFVEPGPPTPVEVAEVVVEWTVTDDRAVLGIGDRFVERVLGLEAADSLAEEARYRDAVAELGGPSSAGITWLDLRGIRLAVESAVAGAGADAQTMDFYAREIAPWIEPLDRLVGVARLDGDLLVSSVVLLVE